MQKCIVVMGMHRSGTSALMGVLHTLGVELGENCLNPAEDNPKGFFENKEIVDINEKILRSLNSSWDSPFLLPGEWWRQEHLEEYKDEIAGIVERQLKNRSVFGIKDPRISRLLPLWKIIFEELGITPYFIIMLRNPMEVAESLKKRDGFTFEKAFLLWMEYMLEAELYSRPFPRVYISFDELLRSPGKIIGSLSGMFGINFPRSYTDTDNEIVSFLDPNLKHHREDSPGSAGCLPQDILDYYHILVNSNLTDKIGADELLKIDLIREKFFQTCRLFYDKVVIRAVLEHDEAVAERDEAVAERDEAMREMASMSAELDAIHSSNVWKIATRYYELRDNFLITRSLYRALKIIRNEGFKALLHKLKEKAIDGAAVTKKEIMRLGRRVLSSDKTAYAYAKNTGKYDVVFFPMIDFKFRYQRPQQLASYFAEKGHRVFYMNISKWLPLNSSRGFKIKEVKKNVYEVFLKSPEALDIYGGHFDDDSLNALFDSMNSLRRHLGLVTVVSLVHNPFFYRLIVRMKKEHGWKIIYDCMDEWETFEGIKEFFLEQEKLLLHDADIVTVTAKRLHDKWGKKNPSCLMVRNACDFKHFRKASANNLLKGVKRPLIGFFGGIADWIDIETIHYAATRKKDCSFVLLGGIFTDVSPIKHLPNVYLPGNEPYELMPDYLYNFDICIIPFRKNKVTEAVDPVKLYEYFSLGKPVVARDLDEIRLYEDVVYLYDTKEGFVDCIEKALDETDTTVKEKRKGIAAANTWEERVNSIDNTIKGKYGKVSIVIVTYNNLTYNRLCIESVLSNTDYPAYEIIVVDNHSSDGTPEYLKDMASRSSNITLILNNENAGFAKANNQGIEISTGDYIVLLNNDTIVTHGWLTKFVNYLDNHPEIGLIGPVTNSCGNEAKIDVDYKNPSGIEAFAHRYARAHEGTLFDIRMLALFCTAMRREIIENVGLLDESFGVGMFEDDDYSHRVKLKGYRVVCAEDIFVHHFGQGSFKKLMETGEYNDIFKRNRDIFEKKWGVKWEPHQLRNPERLDRARSDKIARTKEHWGKEAGTWAVGRGIFWLEHEEVQERINRKVSGNPHKNPMHHLKDVMTERGYAFPVDRCLTLGCGAGDLERGLAQLHFCSRHDAFDISDKAIEKAIAAANEKKLTHIHYEVRDVNEIRLPENTYDVIFGVGAVHHFEKLEHIFSEVNKALRPDGIFFMNEYVGPSRFQWTDRQLDVINAVLKILPKKYKKAVTGPATIKNVEKRPDVKMVESFDPSEAIRSEEILLCVKKYFDILEVRELGGTILHQLLANIAGNFKPDNKTDVAMLKAVFDLEDALLESGDISSDFAVVIAKKRVL